MLLWFGYLQGLKKTHLAAIRPAVIFSCPEAPEPFHTKIFLPEDKNVNMKSKNILREKMEKDILLPESRTNTSPWFIEDQAMSTCKKASISFGHF